MTSHDELDIDAEMHRFEREIASVTCMINEEQSKQLTTTTEASIIFPTPHPDFNNICCQMQQSHVSSDPASTISVSNSDINNIFLRPLHSGIHLSPVSSVKFPVPPPPGMLHLPSVPPSLEKQSNDGKLSSHQAKMSSPTFRTSIRSPLILQRSSVTVSESNQRPMFYPPQLRFPVRQSIRTPSIVLPPAPRQLLMPSLLMHSRANESNESRSSTNKSHDEAVCIEAKPLLYNTPRVVIKVVDPPPRPPEETVPTVAPAKPQTFKTEKPKQKEKRKRKFIRMAGGEVWEDETLQDWDVDDFRLFCGDLGNEVNDDTLSNAFKRYPSFQKAKVIRDKRTGKTKGYGFVSFKDSQDFIKAMREMNGKYVGNRPIKLRKSSWKDRNIEIVKKKQREKALLTPKILI